VKPLTIWRNGGTSTETRLQVFGKQTNQGDFAITPGTGSTGSIAASGNIQGHTLQPTSTNTTGGTCPSIGLISKDNMGNILSCVNGKWSVV
ncbi:prepilin-type cleavage/methylation domain-containing protein, partial [Salmonella enterica subsp. enterica serovar Enteritidis]|nr:prepilin-type cleavage/methylation domain-containing protein [Salmonella enterica subsp. enterica serovar Enteritidis]